MIPRVIVGRRLSFVIACVVAAMACSSFDADAPSVPEELAEAGAPEDVTPAPDAPEQADAEAGPLSFCATQLDAAFCWSFDETGDPLLGPRMRFNGGNDIAPVLTDAATSAPYAMLAAAPDSGFVSKASALAVTQSAAGHIRCELSIFIEVRSTAGPTDILYMPSPNGTSATISILDNGSDASVLSRVHANFGSTDIGNIPVGTWSRVALSVDLVDGGVAAKGTIPGAEATHSVVADGGAFDPLGNVDVYVGLTFASADWKVRFDDVVCRTQ